MPLLPTRLFAAVLLLACGLVHAAPPSQAQIDQLLEVTRARESIVGMLPQIQASQQQMIQQMLAGRELSAQQQRELDTMVSASMKAVAALLSWDELQPLYRDLYAQSFDAEEVQAMIDFYASPAGQSMVQKMPQLMHNAMQAVQTRLLPLLKELQDNLETHSGAGGHEGHPH